MRNIFRKKKFIAIVLLLLAGLYFLYNYGTVTVSLGGGETTYQLEPQKTYNSSTFENTKKSSITKLAKRGDYVLLAKNSSKSFYATVSVKRFLRNTRLTADFQAEKSREYVGYSPGPCTFYAAGTLYSQGSCGTTTELTAHYQATSDTPTYNQKIDTDFGDIKGALHTKEGTLLFGKKTTSDNGDSLNYTAYDISKGLSAPISIKHELTELNKSLNFTFTSYKDGFLAHDTTDSNIFYYSTSGAKGEKIDMPSMNDTGMRKVSVSVMGDTFLTVYSNRAVNKDLIEIGAYDDASDKDLLMKQKAAPKIKAQTKLSIYQAGKNKQLILESYYSKVALCGTNKICTLSEDSNRVMTVFDNTGKSLKKLYSIENVGDIISIKDSMLMFWNNNILAFNADSRSGSIEFSLGALVYCGVYEEGDNYMVCAADSRSNSAMIMINRSVSAVEKIDLVLSKLLSLSRVKDVSVYKKKVFINLNTGDDLYDEATRSFVFDSVKQKAALRQVDQELVALGVDLKSYEIITLPR